MIGDISGKSMATVRRVRDRSILDMGLACRR
jgi:hypothetical protein